MDTYREFCIRFWEATRELDLYSMDGSKLDRLIVDALSKTNGGKELIKTSMNELSVLIRAINHNNRKIHPPSLPSALEEAAENYYEQDCPYPGEARVVNNEHDVWFPSQAIEDAFIAGANWQKEQDNYDTIFHKGMMYYRKQMMEEAVETEVTETCGISSVWIKTKQFKPGQKVRIIIVKEEENGQSD